MKYVLDSRPANERVRILISSSVLKVCQFNKWEFEMLKIKMGKFINSPKMLFIHFDINLVVF